MPACPLPPPPSDPPPHPIPRRSTAARAAAAARSRRHLWRRRRAAAAVRRGWRLLLRNARRAAAAALVAPEPLRRALQTWVGTACRLRLVGVEVRWYAAAAAATTAAAVAAAAAAQPPPAAHAAVPQPSPKRPRQASPVPPVLPPTAPLPSVAADESSWRDEDGTPHWLQRAAKDVGMLPPSSAHPLSLAARRAAHAAACACRAALARWRERAYGGTGAGGWRGEGVGGERGRGTEGGGGRDASLQPPQPPRVLRRRPRLPPRVAAARAASWYFGANARRRCAAALLRWLAEAAARREDEARATWSAIIAQRARLNAAVTAWCSWHAGRVAYDASLERRCLRRTMGRWGRAAAGVRRAACIAALEVSWRVDRELRWRDERRAQQLRGFGAWFAAWRRRGRVHAYVEPPRRGHAVGTQ